MIVNISHEATQLMKPRLHRCARDPRCSCDCIRARCPATVHAEVCLVAKPFVHGPEEDRGWRARVDNLVASLRSYQRTCTGHTWDEAEFLLKASVYSDERVLIMGWVLAWLRSIEASGTCFPRLHVVSDLPEEASAWRGLFRGVPNVTVHALRYPFEMDAYYAIQWPMMWADNFTAAHTRHVFVLDTDSPPVLPLRCHQLFDRQERPLWATWPNLGLRWVDCSDAVVRGLLRGSEQRWPSIAPVQGLLANTSVPPSSPFLGYLRQLGSPTRRRGGGGGTDRRGLDLMTFFPVVIPRNLLAPVRALLSAACRPVWPACSTARRAATRRRRSTRRTTHPLPACSTGGSCPSVINLL